MNVLVKICGVRRHEDALFAAELGAAAIGFVFWPGSPRFIDPYRARAIVAALPAFVTAIGVFVDQPEEYICGVAGLVRLGAVQLHGNEPVERIVRAPYRVIKSVAVGTDFDPADSLALPKHVTVLLDAHDPARRGGTGRTIDWSAAARIARTRRTILSGGLNASNARQAIDIVNPYAIDVSSGVEVSPGVKDPAKLRELFAAIHG
jgi:phosphoribosylanthranilate isomerase